MASIWIYLHIFAFVWPQLCVKQTELVFDICFRGEFKIYWEFLWYSLRVPNWSSVDNVNSVNTIYICQNYRCIRYGFALSEDEKVAVNLSESAMNRDDPTISNGPWTVNSDGGILNYTETKLCLRNRMNQKSLIHTCND